MTGDEAGEAGTPATVQGLISQGKEFAVQPESWEPMEALGGGM